MLGLAYVQAVSDRLSRSGHAGWHYGHGKHNHRTVGAFGRNPVLKQGSFAFYRTT